MRSSFLKHRHGAVGKHFNQQGSDSGVVGWISITDCLLLGLGVLLAISFYLKNEKQVVESRLATSNAALKEEEYKRKLLSEDFKSQASSWREKLSRISKRFSVNNGEKEALKVAVGMLDQQSEKIQKLEEEKVLSRLNNGVLSSKNRSLEKQLDEKKKREKESEISLRRELVGFKGDLQRVAFVIDRSGSMEKRWENAKSTIMNWITALEIKECVVFMFGDPGKPAKYPRPFESKSIFPLSGEGREQSIDKIRKILQATKPEGKTDTYDALKFVYQFPDIDTIVLFTDGAPFLGKAYTFNGEKKTNPKMTADSFLIQETQKLCEQNKHIPVNVVGVGNFYEPAFAGFLLQLAKISDGTFLGRGD